MSNEALSQLIPDPKVRLVIYQKLLTILNRRSEFPFMCNRLIFDIFPVVFKSTPGLIRTLQLALDSKTISIILPEIVKNKNCYSDGESWGSYSDYNLRIGILEEAINKVNKLI